MLTTLLYVVVAVLAVLSTPPQQLAQSHTPIAELVRGHGAQVVAAMGMVSLLTGLNGALVQIIMAARVAYGMARRGQAPRYLGLVNGRTRTPLAATLAMTAAILLLALFFPLITLAKMTSAVILVIFATVNLALWRIKRRPGTVGGRGAGRIFSLRCHVGFTGLAAVALLAMTRADAPLQGNGVVI